MHYNLLTEKWISAKKKTGECLVSIRDCFNDADDILSLSTPEFHNTKVWIYVPPITQLLSTIVMAAYFKPETKYKIATKHGLEELVKNGWDKKVINDYLDTYEDRFDLFDEKRPFLQNIWLKKEVEKTKDLAFIANINPIAPSMNAPVFGSLRPTQTGGKVTFIDAYKFDAREFANILVYTASLGLSPARSKYPHMSFGADMSMMVIHQGQTLRETILLNCIALIDNTRPTEDEPDILPDRPIWELDKPEDVKNYAMSDICKNTLLCTFLPTIPVLTGNTDENGLIGKAALGNKDFKHAYFDKATERELSAAYTMYNPWAIKAYKAKGNKEKKESDEDEKKRYMYSMYSPKSHAWALCITATEQLPNGTACRVMESPRGHFKSTPYIYYRILVGDYKYMTSFGCIRIPSGTMEALTDKENHEAAKKFQKIYGDLCSGLSSAARLAGASEASSDMMYRELSSKTENVFYETFIPGLENGTEEALTNSTNELCLEAETILKEETLNTRNLISRANGIKRIQACTRRIKKKVAEEVIKNG